MQKCSIKALGLEKPFWPLLVLRVGSGILRGANGHHHGNDNKASLNLDNPSSSDTYREKPEKPETPERPAELEKPSKLDF
jgi:hypothetical protein